MGGKAWAAHLVKPSASSFPLNPTWAFTQTSYCIGLQGWRRRKSLNTTNQVPAAHIVGLLGASPESKERISLTTCWLSHSMIVSSAGGCVT